MLSIYKGCVTNVVLLKNLPPTMPKSQKILTISDYPGVLSISFVSDSTARLIFEDLDYALLFMDLVSSDGLVLDGFTCTVASEDKDEMDDDDA